MGSTRQATQQVKENGAENRPEESIYKNTVANHKKGQKPPDPTEKTNTAKPDSEDYEIMSNNDGHVNEGLEGVKEDDNDPNVNKIDRVYEDLRESSRIKPEYQSLDKYTRH
jgi:hypothetical protein